MSINELESKCRELRELQRLIEEAQAEAESIKDAIKAAMGDSESVQAGEYRITYKAVTTARIDTAALKNLFLSALHRLRHSLHRIDDQAFQESVYAKSQYHPVLCCAAFLRVQ